MAPKKSKGSTISLLDLQRQNNHRTFQDTLPQFSTAKDENPDGEEGADRSDGVWRPPRQVDDSNDRRGGRFGASGGEDRRGGTDESVVDEDMHWRRGPAPGGEGGAAGRGGGDRTGGGGFGNRGGGERDGGFGMRREEDLDFGDLRKPRAPAAANGGGGFGGGRDDGFRRVGGGGGDRDREGGMRRGGGDREIADEDFGSLRSGPRETYQPPGQRAGFERGGDRGFDRGSDRGSGNRLFRDNNNFEGMGTWRGTGSGARTTAGASSDAAMPEHLRRLREAKAKAAADKDGSLPKPTTPAATATAATAATATAATATAATAATATAATATAATATAAKPPAAKAPVVTATAATATAATANAAKAPVVTASEAGASQSSASQPAAVVSTTTATASEIVAKKETIDVAGPAAGSFAAAVVAAEKAGPTPPAGEKPVYIPPSLRGKEVVQRSTPTSSAMGATSGARGPASTSTEPSVAKASTESAGAVLAAAAVVAPTAPGIMPTSEHFVKAQAAAVAAQAADEKKAYRKRKQELDELRRQEEEESRKHHKALLEQAALAADTIEECRLVIIEDALANIASGANQTATAADDFISLLEASELTSALPSIVALKVAYVELYKNASTREGVDAVVDRMQPVLSAMFINSGLRQHKLLFLTAMPRFAKELQMPRLSAGWGLVEAFWDSLYMKGVIEEQYFTMWYEDTDDETKGRADLLVELTNWMQWITSGSSAALDLEDDNQDSEVSEEEEIDAHLQSRRTKFR